VILPAIIISVNLPRFNPIAPARLSAPFDHADFVYELKHDGFRFQQSDLFCDANHPWQTLLQSKPTNHVEVTDLGTASRCE